MNGYKYYSNVRVMIKSTGEHGEIFESSDRLNFASVFIDGESKCRYFKLDDIIFL